MAGFSLKTATSLAMELSGTVVATTLFGVMLAKAIIPKASVKTGQTRTQSFGSWSARTEI